MTVGIENYGEADEILGTNGKIRLLCTDKGIHVVLVQKSNLTFYIHLPTGRPEL